MTEEPQVVIEKKTTVLESSAKKHGSMAHQQSMADVRSEHEKEKEFEL